MQEDGLDTGCGPHASGQRSHLRIPEGAGLAGVRGAATGCEMEAGSGCGLASASATSSNLRCGVFSTTLLTCSQWKASQLTQRTRLGKVDTGEFSENIKWRMQPVCIIYVFGYTSSALDDVQHAKYVDDQEESGRVRTQCGGSRQPSYV